MTPRCVLFFPGTRPDMYAKAIASGADQVCMDLEDAVAPESKEEARASAVSVLEGADLDPTRFILRINSPVTPEGDRDLAALSELETLRGSPLTLMIPKVDSPEELDHVRNRVSDGVGVLSLIPVVETAKGLACVEELAAADSVSGILFGGLDLSIDLGTALEWDALLYARSRTVHAARLGGVGAIDMPFLNVSDRDGLREEAGRVRKLGFKGKAAIHPDHVEAVQAAFSPSEDEVTRARRVTEAARESKGVFMLDGVMVDRPGIEAARRILTWADAHGR
ncbi:MAG: CoA ester lyase [Gemmatimonadetes bacterium]|nr:CoA ester lyase [Gemmatimonadota bacterium]